MPTMFRIWVLLLPLCAGFSAVAGCARDPVIPEADIPVIPPSPRSAMQGGGGGTMGGDRGPGASGQMDQGGQAGLDGPIIPAGGGKGGAGKGSPFPAAPAN